MGGKACVLALCVYAAAALVDVAECVGNMLPSALGADEHARSGYPSHRALSSSARWALHSV